MLAVDRVLCMRRVDRCMRRTSSAEKKDPVTVAVVIVVAAVGVICMCSFVAPAPL